MRHGEEPGRVHGIPAGARDDDLVHVPPHQRAAHRGELGRRPVGSGAPLRVRSVRIRRGEPGLPLPTGPPVASGVFSAAPASRKCMPPAACQSMGGVDPDTA